MTTTPTSNIADAEQVVRELHAANVTDYCVCAGARNSPLVAVLAETRGVRVYSFFEERAAAFFALGRARQQGRPVAVLTTSGTAAAELLPALIEAYYSGTPIIAVTADRPRRMRGTGAPQAIEQVGLFRQFVEREFDLEKEPLSLDGWAPRAPIHVNIRFDEPLLDAPLRALSLEAPAERRVMTGHEDAPEVARDVERFLGFWRKCRAPFAIVSTLDSDEDVASVRALLLRLQIPAYFESTSGLRGDPALRPWSLGGCDHLLRWAIAHRHDGVLRIGGVPTVRVWRDLDQPHCPVSVLSVSSRPFAGLSRGSFIHAELPALARAILRRSDDELSRSHLDGERSAELLRRAAVASERLSKILDAEPDSEPALIRAVSEKIALADLAYVGNSLPIREWDMAADATRALHVRANRGANGIDGQLSTFFGLLSERQTGWAIAGDLTTLYDLTAPWALRHLADARVRLVVVNNGGGQIFDRMFRRALFINAHELDFAGFADLWRLPYVRWDAPTPPPIGEGSCVIEVRPNRDATRQFWAAYDSLVCAELG